LHLIFSFDVIQHKKEAFWFYRLLTIVYDHVINPGHWTEDMRDGAFKPADLHSRKLKVAGGGTGFTMPRHRQARRQR
jgi:MPBQ/MSBQ methyltransferase